jgi:hypothetical protein
MNSNRSRETIEVAPSSSSFSVSEKLALYGSTGLSGMELLVLLDSRYRCNIESQVAVNTLLIAIVIAKGPSVRTKIRARDISYRIQEVCISKREHPCTVGSKRGPVLT